MELVNRLALILLLLLPSLACAQEKLTLSKMPSHEQVKSAKELIEQVKSAPTKLSTGGYALIDIKLEGKLTSYVVPGSDDCIKTILIPKGQAYEGWLVDMTTNQFTWTRIEPVAWDRVLVTGLKNGTATLIWMSVQNGEATVVAAFQFLIGKAPPKPDPVDPDPIPGTDLLVQAAQADIKAGKGTADDLANYANLYAMYSTSVKNDASLKTVGDLFNQMNTSIDRLLGDDLTKNFPTLRKAVGAELVKRIPTNTGQKIDDSRAKMSDVFLDISKRLQAVK